MGSDNAARPLEQTGQDASPETVCALEAELRRARCEVARLRAALAAHREQLKGFAASRQEVERLSHELERQASRMEHQIAVARQFQSLFNPPALPEIDGVAFAVRYQPCRRVGGDLYDVFDMGNSCVGVLVADIAGYGLAATLVTAIARMAFDTFRQNEYSPRVIMEKVNAHVMRHTLSNQFLTAFLGVLDLETLRMKYVNAAHPCPIVCGPDRFELLDTDGLCCGMFENPHYGEKEISLRPEDRVVLFTRGLIDSFDPNGHPYKETRLHALVKDHHDAHVADLVTLVMEDFRKHVGEAEPTEDVTLLGLELTPRKAVEDRVVIPSEPQLLHRVENRILSRLEALNYGERALFGVRLALEEAVINAMKHGNKMDKAKKVAITCSVTDKECVISVEDEGEGFDPSAVPDPTEDSNLELPHGRGLVLMRAYMDEVKYNEKGNRVVMRKKAPWAD